MRPLRYPPGTALYWRMIFAENRCPLFGIMLWTAPEHRAKVRPRKNRGARNSVAKRYQVAIVGGGPVGVALAVNLGLRGISCALVESRVGLPRIPKGQNLTQRTLEHFQFWGIVDELRAARIMPPGYPIGEVTAYGDLMSPYWQAPPGRELVRPFYSQDNDRMPQYCMEAVLRDKMATLPQVEARFGWTAKTIAHDATGVRVTVAEENGAGRDTIEADYLVGCDGAHS